MTYDKGDHMSLSDPIEEVRVIHGTTTGRMGPVEQRQRSHAQSIRDGILDEVDDRLRRAHDEVTDALELFGLLTVPQHKNLPTLINQMIEQVAEFRRVKS